MSLMTMDCDEFKRRLLTDPMDPDPAFRGHARHCPPCTAEAERALAFEAALRGALAREDSRRRIAPGDAQGWRRSRLLGLLPLLAALVWWGSYVAPDPFGGDGAVVLVGERGEPLGEHAARLGLAAPRQPPPSLP